MTHGIYSRNQLEAKTLADAKKIARQIGAEPTGDKRVKDSWIEAILAIQPQPVSEPAEVETEEETAVTIEYDNSIDGLTQPYVVRFDDGGIAFRHATHAGCMRHCQWKGYTVLDNQEVSQTRFEQDLEAMAESVALENPELVAYDFEKECFSIPVFMGDEPELNDDYLFHSDPEPNRGSGRDNLPRVGDTHMVGTFKLRCAQVATSDYAVVWDVYDSHDFCMGDISMNYAGFWISGSGTSLLATPYEAILELMETAAELLAV